MSYPPTDHDVLDMAFQGIADAIGPDKEPTDVYLASRQSECIEFFDREQKQWYEIVVRPIHEPSCVDVIAPCETCGMPIVEGDVYLADDEGLYFCPKCSSAEIENRA